MHPTAHQKAALFDGELAENTVNRLFDGADAACAMCPKIERLAAHNVMTAEVLQRRIGHELQVRGGAAQLGVEIE
jgi:hypothetical protein